MKLEKNQREEVLDVHFCIIATFICLNFSLEENAIHIHFVTTVKYIPQFASAYIFPYGFKNGLELFPGFLGKWLLGPQCQRVD